MPPLFHVRRVGAGRSPSVIVRQGTPRALRRARSSAEAFLSLGAVSYLFVAFTRVLLRPNERITNAHARAAKKRVLPMLDPVTLVSKRGASSDSALPNPFLPRAGGPKNTVSARVERVAKNLSKMSVFNTS